MGTEDVIKVRDTPFWRRGWKNDYRRSEITLCQSGNRLGGGDLVHSEEDFARVGEKV